MSHTMGSVACVDGPKYDGIHPEGSSYMHFMLPRGAAPNLALSRSYVDHALSVTQIFLPMAKPRDNFIGHLVESFK